VPGDMTTYGRACADARQRAADAAEDPRTDSTLTRARATTDAAVGAYFDL
jgi:hypothetical protein